MNQPTSTAGNNSSKTANNSNLHSGGIHISLSGDAPSVHTAGAVPIPNTNREQIKTLDDLALTNITLDEFHVATCGAQLS